jgi:filamentous hemagglutinin family protein
MSRAFSSLGLLACVAWARVVEGAPAGATVKAGAATVATNGTTTTITQTTERAVIDWRSFDIAANETVTFAQPGTQSATLNRVTGDQFSSLQGSLTANGRIYLVNPNGVLIGNGANVQAASFVATTASIGDSNFMADPAAVSGRLEFNELTTASATGTIVNAGAITVDEGGLVALVAPAVRNSGVITARLGTIELASATRFTLDLFGDDLVRIAVGDSIGPGVQAQARVQAGGQLLADGGKIVLLSVPAAAGVVDDAINLSGIVRAQSVSAGQPGTIELLAAGGRIAIGGSADVSASGAGIDAGTITAIGGEVRVSAGARLNASAAGNGGMIVLGGTLAADGATATRVTSVDDDAVVTACGTTACAADGTGGSGNGGTVRLYSTQGTRLAGDIDVSSAADRQAGTIEVLSNEGLTEFASTARVRARTGENSFAGFVVGIGDTLSVSGETIIDLRTVLDGDALEINRPLYEQGADVRQYVRESDPNLQRRGTDSPLVFHAYAADGNSGYDLAIPALAPAGTLFATSLNTPVGTLRPNGGAPTTLAASAVDPLAAIPVRFTTSPTTAGQGEPFVDAQLAELANNVARTGAPEESRTAAASGTHTSTTVAGGPGVARMADMGRSGDGHGSSPDVFGVNYHVLAPASAADDAGVTEYLCTTPYSQDACHDSAASAQ